MKIEKIDFHGLEAIQFEASGYLAIMVPSMGASVVKLFHKPTQADILRTPTADDINTFINRPQVYGTPMLFPPNRIADGTYTYGNKTYHFPITIAKENNYHHGILKSQPFVISKTYIEEHYVEVEASFFSNVSNDVIYKNFPHQFECRVNLVLSDEGLEHAVTFINNSDTEMPMGFGFHTPIMVPFLPNSENADYRMRVSVGKEWELNERTLPTENFLELDKHFAALRTEGIKPLDFPISNVFTNKSMLIDGHEFNGAIITNIKNNISVYYEVDEQYTQWTLWNNGADQGYVCPEPQTWAINAPNLKLPANITGLQAVDAIDAWCATTKLYVK